MNNLRNIAKKRLIKAKTESLLIVVSLAFAASVLFSSAALSTGFVKYFLANAEKMTGNSLAQVLSNAKTNFTKIGDYLYEVFEYVKTGEVEEKDLEEYVDGERKEVPWPIPLADNADNLFSADASVENLPLTVALISAVALLCVCVAVSLAFDVSKRERRSFYATLLASGATQSQIKKCLLYEAMYYCAAAIPGGAVLSFAELLVVKKAAAKVLGNGFAVAGTAFNVDLGAALCVVPAVSLLTVLLACLFSLSVCRKLSVRTVATDVKRTFTTSIGNRVLTDDARKYKLLGWKYYVAFRNLHNNLDKYIRIIFMTVVYTLILCSSLMIFTAMRNYMMFEKDAVGFHLIAFSYASEIYVCAVAALIALITVISTFNAIYANVISNEGEYALMRSAGSSLKSVAGSVKMEGFICNAIASFISFVCLLFFYVIFSQAYNREERVDFGSPFLFWGGFLGATLLLGVSVIITSAVSARRMKRIDLIGVLKDYIY